MTETRTNRFGLPLWSSGTDSGSRTDFNEAFTKLNDNAAKDSGVTQPTLPVDDLVPGQYQMVVIGGVYRTLYRRHDGDGWDAVGGNTMPVPFHYRGLGGAARTDAAVTFSHPDADNPGGTIGYDGSALLSGTVRVYDDDETGRGALIVGTNAASNLATLGRAHVRTRAIGERALSLQAHAADAGNLLTAITSGGAAALSVDALGRLRATAPSSFGGAPLPTVSSLAVAPTASDDDDTTSGLLLFGSTGSAEILAKSIMQIWRDAADGAAPLADFKRDSFALGRLPWTNSLITMAATGHTVRAGGVAANPFYWRLRRSDPTSGATEINPANDVTLFGITETGSTHSLPLVVSNRYRTAPVALTVQRITDFSAGFLNLSRLVSDGGGGELAQTAAIWDSDGRLRAGAWWRSTSTVRDARQALHHVCRKVYAAPGTSQSSGQEIASNSSFTLTWTAMNLRSSGTSDLIVTTSIELMLQPNTTDFDSDAQKYSAQTLISINGGAYAEIGVAENAQGTPKVRPGTQRFSGDYFVFDHRVLNVPTGATIQLRTTFTTSTAAPVTWLRSLEVDVEECIIESYATPA